MSRSHYRSNQSLLAQQRKKGAIEQVFVTKKTIPIKTQPVAPDVVEVTAVSVVLPNTVDTVVEQASPDVQLTAPVNVEDRPLREFLLAADIHAQQTFLAQVAMIAAKDAKEHMQKVQDQSLKLAQINLATALQHCQRLEGQYQELQQKNAELKTRYALLTHNQSTKSRTVKQAPIHTPTTPSTVVENTEHSSLLKLQADADRLLSRWQDREARRKRR